MFKIAISGPESTGKTEIAKQLAKHFTGEWMPEFAREYIEKLDRRYTYEDVCAIAEQQIVEQNRFEKENSPGFVFFDTDLIITKVWFEYCFGKVPELVTAQLNKNYFDFYLLCYYDLEWMPDPVREHGDDRQFFFDLYKTEIEKTGKPYAIVTGKGEMRIENAIKALNKFFDTK